MIRVLWYPQPIASNILDCVAFRLFLPYSLLSFRWSDVAAAAAAQYNRANVANPVLALRLRHTFTLSVFFLASQFFGGHPASEQATIPLVGSIV